MTWPFRSKVSRKYAQSTRNNSETFVEDGHTKAEEIQKAFNNVLNKNFSPEDRKDLRENGGIRLVVKNLPYGEAGGYIGKRKGKHEIWINEDDPTNEETLTHEAIHALVEQDDGFFGGLLKIIRVRFDPEKETLLESIVEANTIARIDKLSEDKITYYGFIESPTNKSPEKMKKEDHRLFRNNLAAMSKTGFNNIVSKVYDLSNIQYLKLEGSNKTAREVKKDLNSKNNKRGK